MSDYTPPMEMIPILNIIKGNLVQYSSDSFSHPIINNVSGKITQAIEEFLKDLAARRKEN